MVQHVDLASDLGAVIGTQLAVAQQNLTAPAGSAVFSSGAEDGSAVVVGPAASTMGGLGFLDAFGVLTQIPSITDAQTSAQSAADAAAQAQTTADGKNKVFASGDAPIASAVGDVWYQLDASGHVIGVLVASAIGSDSWVPYTLMADQIIVPGSVGAVQIADGAIVAEKIAAEAITVGHLSADVGKSLDISSNDSVNILVGRVKGAEDGLEATAGTVDDLATYYRFTNAGAVIGQVNDSHQMQLNAEGISLLENGSTIAQWVGQTMYLGAIDVEKSLFIGNHQFQLDETTGHTIVRKVS